MPRLFCPPFKDEADWLVELAGKQASIKPVVDVEAGGSGNAPPSTSEEFHSRWRESVGGKAVQEVGPKSAQEPCWKGAHVSGMLVIEPAGVMTRKLILFSASSPTTCSPPTK